MAECTHDCSTCSSNCAEREIQKEKLNDKSRVKRVIAVMSGKGGVGKSMVTSLLAVAAARRGLKTAILDADVTGPSIPQAFHLKSRADTDGEFLYPVASKTGIEIMSLNLLLENETDPVVWRGPVIAGAVKQFWTDVIWRDVDLMFIDMPPGTGDVPLTVFQSIPVDGIIVVTSPQELVGMVVEKAVNMAKLLNVPLLSLIENFSFYACPDCGARHELFGKSRVEEAAKTYGIGNFARLPIDPKLAQAVDQGMIELCDTQNLEPVLDVIEA